MTVRAAGGIVTRDGEVLLVHRPKYDAVSYTHLTLPTILRV